MDIIERIKAGEFKNKKHYPYSVEVPESSNLSIAEIVDNANGYEKETVEEAIGDYLEYLKELGYYNESIKLYEQGELLRIERFRKALEIEYGTTGHPKADKLWETSWEEGHSSGLITVANKYQKLVELIK